MNSFHEIKNINDEKRSFSNVYSVGLATESKRDIVEDDRQYFKIVD